MSPAINAPAIAHPMPTPAAAPGDIPSLFCRTIPENATVVVGAVVPFGKGDPVVTTNVEDDEIRELDESSVDVTERSVVEEAKTTDGVVEAVDAVVDSFADDEVVTVGGNPPEQKKQFSPGAGGKSSTAVIEAAIEV